jgi:alkylmercury lyase
MTARHNGYARIAIPADVGDRLRAVFGLEHTPATLGDVVAGLRHESTVPDMRELCCAGRSRHEARIGEETYYTHCVMDALMLPFVRGGTAAIRSESPVGGVIGMTVTSEAVETDVPAAVVSFGAARTDQGAVQQTACPYINAFPSRADYDRWAAATPDAVTMAVPLADAFAFIRDVARRGGEP